MKQIEQIKRWLRYETLVHGFTTKKLGNLSFRAGSGNRVIARRKKLSTRLEFDWNNALLPPLTHSNNIVLIDDLASLVADENRIYKSGGKIVNTTKHVDTVHNNPEWQAGIDGIITTTPNLFPVLLTADCAGLAFYPPPSGICGIAHIGVIGAINQLPKKMVYALEEFCGCSPTELKVALYPSIRRCHYNLSHSGAWKVINKDVKTYYGEANPYYADGYFDLQGFAVQQLLEAGIKKKAIFDTNFCTVCHYREFYSNLRADTPTKKRQEGRFASIIGRRG